MNKTKKILKFSILILVSVILAEALVEYANSDIRYGNLDYLEILPISFWDLASFKNDIVPFYLGIIYLLWLISLFPSLILTYALREYGKHLFLFNNLTFVYLIISSEYQDIDSPIESFLEFSHAFISGWILALAYISS